MNSQIKFKTTGGGAWVTTDELARAIGLDVEEITIDVVGKNRQLFNGQWWVSIIQGRPRMCLNLVGAQRVCFLIRTKAAIDCFWKTVENHWQGHGECERQVNSETVRVMGAILLDVEKNERG